LPRTGNVVIDLVAQNFAIGGRSLLSISGKTFRVNGVEANLLIVAGGLAATLVEEDSEDRKGRRQEEKLAGRSGLRIARVMSFQGVPLGSLCVRNY